MNSGMYEVRYLQHFDPQYWCNSELAKAGFRESQILLWP
jgi:hypothetical protein